MPTLPNRPRLLKVFCPRCGLTGAPPGIESRVTNSLFLGCTCNCRYCNEPLPLHGMTDGYGLFHSFSTRLVAELQKERDPANAAQAAAEQLRRSSAVEVTDLVTEFSAQPGTQWVARALHGIDPKKITFNALKYCLNVAFTCLISYVITHPVRAAHEGSEIIRKINCLLQATHTTNNPQEPIQKASPAQPPEIQPDPDDHQFPFIFHTSPAIQPLFRTPYQDRRDWQIEECTKVIQRPDASPEQRARAFHRRADLFVQQGKTHDALADLSAAIKLEAAPAGVRYEACVSRGQVSRVDLQHAAAVADFTAVINAADAEPWVKAVALISRGIAYDALCDSDAEIRDCTTVIEMGLAARPIERANAFLNRGTAYDEAGQSQKAIDDYTAMIEDTSLPRDVKLKARTCRAQIFADYRRFPDAIADCKFVLAIPDAPKHLKQKAQSVLQRCPNEQPLPLA